MGERGGERERERERERENEEVKGTSTHHFKSVDPHSEYAPSVTLRLRSTDVAPSAASVTETAVISPIVKM